MKKDLLLAGPSRSVNPREDQMAKAKRKAMRKIQYQGQKTADEVSAVISNDIDTETATASPIVGRMKEETAEIETTTINAKRQQISAGENAVSNEEESFEMDTVEQEIERSRAGTAKRKPLLSLLLSKRKLQKK
jgi:hypothetical protein